jgi:hypothetical protein
VCGCEQGPAPTHSSRGACNQPAFPAITTPQHQHHLSLGIYSTTTLAAVRTFANSALPVRSVFRRPHKTAPPPAPPTQFACVRATQTHSSRRSRRRKTRRDDGGSCETSIHIKGEIRLRVLKIRGRGTSVWFTLPEKGPLLMRAGPLLMRAELSRRRNPRRAGFSWEHAFPGDRWRRHAR